MPPCLVNSFKLFGFLRQLLGNVCTVEDRLEIHPLALTLEPLLHNVTHEFELVAPFLYSVFERFFEGTELHGLSVD